MLVHHGIHARRVNDIAAMFRMIAGVRNQDMGEIAPGIAQHARHIADAFVVEKGVRHAVDVLHVIAAERLHNIDGFIVLFAEIPGMRLDLHADAFPLKNWQQLFH